MKYYAVIDTNVIVSALLKKDSIPGQIVKRVYDGIIIPLINEEILSEYLEVTTRNKFDISNEEINKLITSFKKVALYGEKEKVLEMFIDHDDIVFYEIVMNARKERDAYLITGNMKHFPKRSFIVTPKEMIDIIEKDNFKRWYCNHNVIYYN